MTDQEAEKLATTEVALVLDEKRIKELLSTTQNPNLVYLRTNLKDIESSMIYNTIIVLIVGLLVESTAVIVFSEVILPVLSLRVPEIWSVAAFTILNSMGLSVVSTLFMNDWRKLETQKKGLLKKAEVGLTNSSSSYADSLT